jgi:hypothetical protein
MTIPYLLFALLIALFIGTLYHLVRDGGLGHLLVFLVASVLGFIGGHFLGVWRGWQFLVWGRYNLGMEVLGSLIFLMISDWLLHLPPRTRGDENAV